jgi:hypothetical protein
MRIYLTTAYHQGVALRFLRMAAQRDRFGVHEIVARPETADVVLMVENAEPADPFGRRLLAHPLVREFAERAFVYNEFDLPYCALPGLYVSMPRRSFDHSRQAAFPYLFQPNELIAHVYDSGIRPDLLFSFMGARNHRVRPGLLALKHQRAHLEDTSAFSIWFTKNPSEVTRRKQAYADAIARSKFVLCPRGVGTSSYRLYEAMEAGRAPVVISDQWTEPAGPDWSSFLVRVGEADLKRVPGLLEGLESEAADRGRAARAAWESWFAPETIFHNAVESVAGLMKQQRGSSNWRMLLHDLELVRFHATRAVLEKAHAGLRFVGAIRRSRRDGS